MSWMPDRASVAIRDVSARLVSAMLNLMLLLLLLVATIACLSDDSDNENDDIIPTISGDSPTSDAAEVTATTEVDDTPSITPTVPSSATTTNTSPTVTSSDGSSTPDVGDGSPVVVLQGPGVTIDDLNEDGDAYLGQRVVVHGEVLEVLGERTFTISDDAETVLAIGAGDVDLAGLTPGTFIRVAGDIQTFDAPALESELGMTFDDTALGRFEGRPVVVIDSVQVGPLGVSSILAADDDIQDQVLGIVGEVSEVIGPQAFVLSDPDAVTDRESILVVTPYLAMPGDDAAGAWVQVFGKIQPLDTSNPAALGEDFGFLSGEEYQEYDGRQVFVAEQVEVVAPGATASVADVVSGGDDLVGQSVVLREVVAEIIGDRAFVVGDDDDERVLVVVAAGEIPPGLGEGSLVVVDGIVTRLDLASPPLIDPTGGVDWNADAIEAFDGELILITRSVVVIASE